MQQLLDPFTRWVNTRRFKVRTYPEKPAEWREFLQRPQVQNYLSRKLFTGQTASSTAAPGISPSLAASGGIQDVTYQVVPSLEGQRAVSPDQHPLQPASTSSGREALLGRSAAFLLVAWRVLMLVVGLAILHQVAK